MRAARTTRTSAALLATTILALGACANEPKPVPFEPNSTSESTPAAAPAKPNAIDSAPLPAGDVRRAPATVYTDCDAVAASDGGRAFNTTAQVFNPRTGVNVALPAPVLPAGQRLVRAACTVGGDLDHTRVFYVLTRSTPSNGFTPQAQVSEIVAFDPFNPGAPQVKPLPAGIDPATVDELIPTKFGFMIERRNPRQTQASDFIGFDATTLGMSFTIDGSGPVPQNFVNPSAVLIYFYGGEVRIHSAKDGHVLGDFQESGDVSVYPNGFVYDGDPTRTGHVPAFFNTEDGQAKVPFAAGGGDMWGNTYLKLDDHALEIRDAPTNAVILRREGADFDTLHINSAWIAGKYLYLHNQADDPVIDYTRLEKVASGWSVRPTDVVNRDWLLVQRTNPESRSAGSCFDRSKLICDPKALTLRRAPNGEYAGPWY